MLKSAASAVSPKTKSTGRPGNGSAGGRRPPGAPLGLASLDLVFGEAALAADLIMAFISLHVPILRWTFFGGGLLG